MKPLGGIFVDGQYLYTWGPGYIPEWDKNRVPKDTVYIYDKASNFVMDGMLVEHGQAIRCVASSAKHIFLGGMGGKDLTGYRYYVLCTYDKVTQLLLYEEGADDYYAESLCTDPSYLYMGTNDSGIVVRELDTLREIRTIYPENTRMSGDILFAGETSVYSGSSSGNLIAWEKENFALEGSWPGHVKEMSSLIGSKNLLFSGDWGGEIIAWEIDTHIPRVKWTAHSGTVRDLAVHGALLFSCGGDDEFIKVWETGQYHEVLAVQHHPARIVALAADEGYLYAGYEDGVVGVWQISQLLERIGRV